jgi:multicomponent Na+:H+ antiporter subunit A
MLLAALLAGFPLAVLAPSIHRLAGKNSGWLLAGYPALVFALALQEGASGATPSLPWLPSLGIGLSLYVDGLAVLFALLISGIGTGVLIYAGAYLDGHPQLGRFFAFLLAFMAAMLGVVLAGNLFALFVFWELTSITSYLLIGFDHAEEKSRKAALQALLVTGIGGLALLAGVVLLQRVAGTVELAELLSRGRSLNGETLYVPIVLLVFAGAFTKSAQVPFHFWLPAAMAAPTPVSAYLHSATMVKGGVYLLARLNPVLGGSDLWQYGLLGFGALTMMTGAVLGVAQSDLKRLLAYSTVGALGTLTMMIGIDSPLSALALAGFLLTHSLYKGGLFLVAGAVDHEAGTRDIDELGGLARSMRWTFAAAALAGLSMAGLPPLLGFVGKELVYEALLQPPTLAPLLAALAVFANALFLAVAGFVVLRPFLGAHAITPKPPHEAPPAMLLGPLLLGALGLVLGIATEPLVGDLLGATAAAVHGAHVGHHIALWHGLTPALFLSALTVVAGVILFLMRPAIRAIASRLSPLAACGPTRLYGMAIDGLFRTAHAQTRFLQAGLLRRYILFVIVTTLVLAGGTFFAAAVWPAQLVWNGVQLHEAAVGVVILLGTVTALRASSRLTAVVALGAVGYGVALVFLLFGAPDLAMTQFAIETLIVVLFVLVLYRLPPFVNRSPPGTRRRDALVASFAGLLMTALLLLVSSTPSASRLAGFFAENSLPHAKGRNVVNVILVDFRGLDTLGEITVLAIAAIGVFALLKLRPKEKDA